MYLTELTVPKVRLRDARKVTRSAVLTVPVIIWLCLMPPISAVHLLQVHLHLHFQQSLAQLRTQCLRARTTSRHFVCTHYYIPPHLPIPPRLHLRFVSGDI